MGMADASGAMALFGFLAVGAVALFSMIGVTSWAEARRKEREAYYKSDMLKKISESSTPGATAAIEYLHEQQRIGAERTRQGLRIGGLVTVAAGIGTLVFLRALIHVAPVYLCGLIPLLVGFALYASSYLVTTTVE